MLLKVCRSAVIFAPLVRVWASADTTISRTFFQSIIFLNDLHRFVGLDELSWTHTLISCANDI